jgi:hypothetical protein
MKRNDYIALIIEHIVNQGYKSSDAFVNYITNELVNMSTEALADELEALEINAIGLSM